MKYGTVSSSIQFLKMDPEIPFVMAREVTRKMFVLNKNPRFFSAGEMMLKSC
jgi:hypothetical protein